MRIKSNQYERISYKKELDTPKINTFIKNTIIIKTHNSNKNLIEYALHQTILENMDDF